MVNDPAKRIQSYLEAFYDIGFDVKKNTTVSEPLYSIKPQNDARELFDIAVKIKERLRIIIEVFPEKHAAWSIKDMSEASIEKKRVFSQFASQLLDKKARLDFYINEIPCDIRNPQTWTSDWTSYRLRLSRRTICDEDEDYDEIEVITSWSSIVVGMFLSLLNVELVESEDDYFEGGVKRVEINRYERNPVNRELCLAANGYRCKICGFDFARYYGMIGYHFIHVHHIVPVSTKNESYSIDPVNDLIPVCPNCHAMLHRKNPPLSPSELKDIMEEQRKKYN